MSAIAGIYHLETAKPVDPGRLRQMLAPMQHRGPDESGTWTAAGVGLAHLRLALIDAETGAQPMLSDDENAAIIVDGEIFNYRELRSELRDLGHRFATDSDSEVILAAWRQWGPHCLERLNGSFAFAIHDHMAGQLFLARDRLGIKPLHYVELADGSVAFASEIKGLLAHPLLRAEPNLSALEDYLAFGFIPDDNCMLLGVRKLAAGHHLSLARGKPLPRPVQYWDADFSRRVRASQRECEEHLVALLRAAVSTRLAGDVAVGALLSGGLDSAALVALMAEASRGAILTASLGFRETAYDESAEARAIAERYAADHRRRVLSIEDAGLADRVVAHFDEPFADPAALLAFRTYELAREHMGAALTGDGADAVFAGDAALVAYGREERLRRWLPAGFRSTVLGPLGSVAGQDGLQSLARPAEEAFAETVTLTQAPLRRRLWSKASFKALDGYRPEERYWRIMQGAPVREALDRAHYAELKIGLPGRTLTQADRMAMAVSIEPREPFLDHRLVEFAATLPADLRVRRGQGKYLLRRAMQHYLPDATTQRPPAGFAPPVADWLRGALAPDVANLTETSALARTGWFDMKQLGKLITRHQAGKADHSALLWQLVMLDKAVARLFGA